MAKQKLESKGFYGIAEYLELKKTNTAVDLSGDLHAPVDQGVQTSLSEMADQTDRNMDCGSASNLGREDE